MAVTEEQLAELLQELLEQRQRGQTPDLEAAIRLHPEVETELRELWATALIAEDLGSFATLGSEIPPAPPPAPESREKPVVAGYELLELLGRGGMGLVYKARQARLGRTVALKMILRGQWATADDIARFETEARAAAKLNHPNIVSVYEVGEYEGQPYFTMELIEGQTLAQRLADGPLASREAAELMIPICSAVAEAHRNGILHRDLKASNILLDRQDRPYVTDFGLAKRLSGEPQPADSSDATTLLNLTHSGAIVGTPGYMAPEQAAGRRGQVTALSDVYGLGALLYAMLTGRPPFQAASPVDVVLMALEQDPVAPRLLNPRIDPDLEMIVMKSLQKPVDLRYQSVAELSADLQAYLNHEPVSARSSHFTQILSRMFRETHHAGILENWGLLWMWHSLVTVALCVATNVFQYMRVDERWPYLGLWVVGMSIWAVFFWNLRRRSGPITFVERQIAHIWGGSMLASMLLFVTEIVMGLPVLTLSPILGIISGMVFMAKAGILNGMFYFQAISLFLTSLVMAWLYQRAPGEPNPGVALIGLVMGGCFFFPGLIYHLQRLQGETPR